VQDNFYALLLAAGWLVGVILFIELGRYCANRFSSEGPDDEKAGFGALEGSIFALFGLLVAFTFSGAASRFDSRRELIAVEANDIGTAFLRVDLLPEESQPAIRSLFGDYLESRIETYRRLPDVRAALKELDRSIGIQQEIWDRSVAATRSPTAHPDAAKMLIPALNNMIDVTTTRTMAMKIHPPVVIFVLLFVVGLVCALLIGHRSARAPRSWFHILIYAIVTGVCFFVILDIEYPRAGLIRLVEYDEVLVDLLKSIRK
jgi:hypothetical protein